MQKSAAVFGIVGALNAFPRRLAAKALSGQRKRLRRGITRQTSHVVVGRRLLTLGEAEIDRRLAPLAAADITLLSENGLLELLGLRTAPQHTGLTRQSLLEQSRLDAAVFDRLALFDAFEHSVEPFSFRDLILSRKYAGLVAGGAGWWAIARAVHRAGPVSSLTALSLHPEDEATIYALDGAAKSELDGQRVLDLEPSDEADEEYFELAASAETAGLFAEAAVLYGQCLAIDPTDSVAAFNQANCLRASGDADAAGLAYARAIKLDPAFVEAWFNHAGLLRDTGRTGAARQHLLRAVEIDPAYGDAVYNLASLEFDAGNLAEARRWWSRYLELDQTSEWARTATRGIAYADAQLRRTAG